VRTGTFLLAIAALLFACVDFWQQTRTRLEDVRRLQKETAALLEEGIARARRAGAPPSLAELDAANTRARVLGQDSAALRSAWYADAVTAADYLVPRAARPPPVGLSAERERISQALLALPADLKAHPGLSAAELGLFQPSLSAAFPSDPGELANQAERAAAARVLVDALRAAGPVRVDDATLQRTPESGLVLRLDAVATMAEVVPLYEQLLAPSEDAPPRALKRFELTRIDPKDWGQRAKELAAPPVRVSFVLAFDFPSSIGAAR
jgi:hypothetical protein